MRMSYKYTTTKELVKGLNTSSINLVKVVSAFVRPKGMTNHSKRPYLDLKVVFQTSIGSMGTWWHARLQVNLVEELFPLSWSRRSSIIGIGYQFLTMILFNSL
jgi:hypothetical protein